VLSFTLAHNIWK